MAPPEAYQVTLPGEQRLALVSEGQLAAMRIARDGDGLAAGAVLDARLTKRAGMRGFAEAGGQQLLVQPWPSGSSEGATVRLEIQRAAWTEPGRERLAKARPAPTAPTRCAPTLEEQAATAGAIMRPGWPDHLAEQWDDAFQHATLGRWLFPGGTLNLQPTPAFLAVDVDGESPEPVAACTALARLIRLWDLSGSIVVDLPGADRAARQSAAAAIDAGLAGQPFERTAINGFGLMQIVLPRRGPSMLERAMLDRAGTAAIALLAAALREPRPGALRLEAAPPIARWLTTRPHLVASLARASGRPVDVAANPVAGKGHVAITPA